jgi:hypothetical protein
MRRAVCRLVGHNWLIVMGRPPSWQCGRCGAREEWHTRYHSREARWHK